MYSLLWLIHEVIWLYTLVIIGAVILSWLVTFGVVNTRNRFVYSMTETFYRLSDVLLRPIRSVLPNLGGLDISPVVGLLLLMLVDRLIYEYLG